MKTIIPFQPLYCHRFEIPNRLKTITESSCVWFTSYTAHYGVVLLIFIFIQVLLLGMTFLETSEDLEGLVVNIRDYEKRLKILRNSSEQEVLRQNADEISALVNSLKLAYRRVLLDRRSEQLIKDPDMGLWKVCFYRTIEEFRKVCKNTGIYYCIVLTCMHLSLLIINLL